MSAARPPALLPLAVAAAAVAAQAAEGGGGMDLCSSRTIQCRRLSPPHLKRREEEGPISPTVRAALALKRCPRGGGEQ